MPADTTRTFAAPAGWSDDAAADPDLANTDTTGGGADPDNDLDVIANELGGDLAVEVIQVPVEGRDGWVGHYRSDFTGRDIDGLRKQAKDRKFADGFDGIKFGSLLLGLTCVGISRHGQDMVLDGSALTFASKGLQDSLGTRGVVATVRKVYGGRDGFIDAAARKIMEDAGWGDDAPDPS